MGIRRTHEIVVKEIYDINPNIEILSEFKTLRDKMHFRCKICGHEWDTRPEYILYRHTGCNKCADKSRKQKNTKPKELFIKQIKDVHGDKYDYSLVEYKTERDKIAIICKKHNYLFWQRAGNHLRGDGCPLCRNDKCGDKFRSNTERFINKSKTIHGDKFNYDKTNYIDCNHKVCITCKKHGDFEVLAPYHFDNKYGGCPECEKENAGLANRKTIEEFVEQANKIHNNKYDYSCVNYKNDRTNIEIICHKHGSFYQMPCVHLRGSGCPYCRKESFMNDFLSKAKIKFGDKFDYSKIDYVDYLTPVCIICPEHGEFYISPHAHLHSKYGCPECMKYFVSQERTLTTEEFISRAKETHGENTYDYSKTDYKGYRKKVCITCKTHGDFWQLPYTHLSGSGCPTCNKSKGEKFIEHYLSEHNINFIPQYPCKIPNKYNIKADFYVKIYNKEYIIEYNGLQHYMPVKHFGGQEKFNRQQKRDKAVKDFCSYNNIIFVEIKYDKTQEEIEKILDNIINNTYE